MPAAATAWLNVANALAAAGLHARAEGVARAISDPRRQAGQKQVPKPRPRSDPASPASGVGLEFELALPEAIDVVLYLHPVAHIPDAGHLAASLASMRDSRCDPAPARIAVRRGVGHRADDLSLWLHALPGRHS